MSKLFKLKEWFTIPETASRLSSVLMEPVTNVDVLRLIIDGQLQPSIRFIEMTSAMIVHCPEESGHTEGETIFLHGTYKAAADLFLEEEWQRLTFSGEDKITFEKMDEFAGLDFHLWIDENLLSFNIGEGAKFQDTFLPVIRTEILRDFETTLLQEYESEKAETLKILNPKVTDSLLKMIIAMAIDSYGYDPRQKKSPTTQDITEAMEKVKLNLDPDTIRKHLKKSAQLLDQDTMKNLFPT